MWTKYDYVCTNCDSLVEITAQVPEVMYPDCICGNSMIIGIGRSPAFEPSVMEFTQSNVVKINSNQYN